MKQNPWTGHFVDEEGNTWFADEDLKVDGVNNWAQAPNKGAMPLKDWRQDPNGGNFVDNEGKHWTGYEPTFPGNTWAHASAQMQTPPLKDWK